MGVFCFGLKETKGLRSRRELLLHLALLYLTVQKIQNSQPVQKW